MTRGVKGSAIYTKEGVGDLRVALSSHLVRGAGHIQLYDGLQDILTVGTNEFVRDAVTMMFLARDVRGGKGEREVFYTLFRALFHWNKELARAVMSLIPEYGCWRDVFYLSHQYSHMRDHLLNLAAKQFLKDEEELAKASEEYKPKLSLVAKWAPREGKHYGGIAKEFARRIIMYTEDTTKMKHSQIMCIYRNRLSRLNKYLKTVEVLECANRWDEIEPAHVPGRARELKKKAYFNELVKSKPGFPQQTLRYPTNEKRMACRKKFQEFFAAAAAGKKKMTGTETLYPHEIVKRMFTEYKEITDHMKDSLNAMWGQMVEKAGKKGGIGASIIMCDFSGSMEMCSRTRDTPYWVSLAMGLLGSELCSSPFKGRFLTFDSNPTWCTIPDEAKTLYEKATYMKTLQNIGIGLSTDFQKATNLIIEELKKARVPPGEGPKDLIVITDMGFDEASREPLRSQSRGKTAEKAETHIQRIKAEFEAASEEIHGDKGAWPAPRIVIWNVSASYSDNFQAEAEEGGVLTLSGWSPTLFKMLCENGPRPMTPLEGLRAQLDDKRYDPVRERVDTWLTGGWRGIL